MLEAGRTAIKKSRSRGYRGSLESRAHGQQEALRLLAEGMEAAGLDARELGSLKGSDARKVAIARVIRQRTTVSMGWIAEHLSMRSAANASQQILRMGKRGKAVPKPLNIWAKLS